MTPTPQPLTAEEIAAIRADAYSSEWRLLPLETAKRLLAHISSLEAKFAELSKPVPPAPSGEAMERALLRKWASLSKGLGLTTRSGNVADYDDELASLLSETAIATLAWREEDYHRKPSPAIEGLPPDFRIELETSIKVAGEKCGWILGEKTLKAFADSMVKGHWLFAIQRRLTSDRAATEARVREECAKVADEYVTDGLMTERCGARAVAAAIRAGDKT